LARRLTDTGKQIDQDMRSRYGRTHSESDAMRRECCEEDENDIRERPAHPLAAIGSTFLVVAALVAALTLTALFFISAIVAVSILVPALLILGAWAFWSWGQRRRARRESSTLPGEAVPGE
jgi:Flp pilus assembly protein TadB